MTRYVRWTARHPALFGLSWAGFYVSVHLAAHALSRATPHLAPSQPRAAWTPPVPVPLPQDLDYSGPGQALSPPRAPRDPSNPSRAVPPPLDPSPFARTWAALQAGDMNQDGLVDARDLAQMLAHWGPLSDPPPIPLLTLDAYMPWWVGDSETGYGVWTTRRVAIPTAYIVSARVVYPTDLDAALFYEFSAGVLIPPSPVLALWCNAWAIDPYALDPLAPIDCSAVSNHPSRPTRFFVTADVDAWTVLTGQPLPPPADGAGPGGGDDGSP